MSLQPVLLSVLLLAVVALAVVAGMLTGAHLLGPRHSTPVKQMPYESGMDPIGDARGRFDIRYYLVAIVFLIFDVELLFLYPWAVTAWDDSSVGLQQAAERGQQNPAMIFGEVVVFIVLLGLAYLYAWRKGVFDWTS